MALKMLLVGLSVAVSLFACGVACVLVYVFYVLVMSFLRAITSRS